MTAFALFLVLTAAFFHASWNFLAKRVGGGAAFVWLFGVLSTLLYAPLAISVLVFQQPSLKWPQLSFMVGSGAIHAVYFLLLQQGYRVGDLSLVYPLARGTGPMLATVAAIPFLNEHPTQIALLGTFLIASSIVLLTSKVGQEEGSTNNRMQSLFYALLTGTCTQPIHSGINMP